ncbi:MAG: PQQ-dependent sugar dehydrogenase [Pseudomonadota bacterium]
MSSFIARVLSAAALVAPLFAPLFAPMPAAADPVETIADDLSYPWALAFLPEGDFLVTERTGTLRRVSRDGVVSDPLDGVPPVYFAGQGGLMEVRLHPQFEDNGLVYLSYAHGDAQANAMRVIRGRLTATGLAEVEPVFTVSPMKDTPVHYGGRLAFMADGTLLITTGDGFNYREAAQDLKSLLGKTVRVTDSGDVPPDNPFVGDDRADPRIFSYGHRNPQGLVVDAEAQTIYLHEHGPMGGDEINVLSGGQNYGWPAATWGMDYTGAHVSPFQTLPGVTDPMHVWTPSIAPSGMTLWRGALLVGALVDQEVRAVPLDGGEERRDFVSLDTRVREVRSGPDGCLYLLTDGAGGALLRRCG